MYRQTKCLFGRVALIGVVTAAVVVGMAQPVQGASLEVVDASVLYKPSTGLVYFDVTFTRDPVLAPAVQSTDGDGSLAELEDVPPTEGFQILIDVQPDDPQAGAFPWEVVVRGTEASDAQGIPLRNAQTGPVDDPNSGGWGEVIGISPLKQDGATLHFAAPNSWIGVTDADKIGYELITLQDGTIVDRYVPTPSAVLAGMAMLGWMTMNHRRRLR